MYETELPAAESGSVEALLSGAGLSLLDLRAAPLGGPQRMRHADQHISVPAFEAFDALVHVLTLSPTSIVPRTQAAGG